MNLYAQYRRFAARGIPSHWGLAPMPVLLFVLSLLGWFTTVRGEQVLELDGETAWVEIADFATYAPTNEITIEFWQFVNAAKVQSAFSIVPDDSQNRISAHTPWQERSVFWDFGAIASGRLSYRPPEPIAGSWHHFALVASASQNAMRIYRNGVLEQEGEKTTSFARREGSLSIGGPERLSNWGNNNTSALFGGQIDEFRIWSHARTTVQILDNMFSMLTGNEPGLVGLWSFDDSTARDSSPNGRHGVLRGAAKIVASSRPTRADATWARLRGTLVDPSGKPVPEVTVYAESAGTTLGHARTDSDGAYTLTLWTSKPSVDLWIYTTNRLGGWKLDVPLTPNAETELDSWELGPALDIGGRLTALDGTTPLESVVVELVRPAANEGNLYTEHEPNVVDDTRVVANRAPPAAQSFPFASGGNLELDGESGYVELPKHSFDELTEATVEGWVRWDQLDGSTRDSLFFSFGGVRAGAWRGWYVSNDGVTGRIKHGIFDSEGASSGKHIGPDIIRPGVWAHVAAVSGPGGRKLYFNGDLAMEHENEGSFASLGPTTRNYLGKDTWASNKTYFNGGMDEVRVWNTARSQDEIRATMNEQLQGDESGLVALWNFDDGTARDASPSGHDGTLMGGALVLKASEEIEAPQAITQGSPFANGRNLELDGEGGYVELPEKSFDELTEATVEGWVRWDRLEGNGDSVFFSFGDVRTRNTWPEWYVSNHKGTGRIKYGFFDSEGFGRPHSREHTGPDIIWPGEWVHVAAVSGPGGYEALLQWRSGHGARV